MATESPLWPTDINKHFSWPAPWSHGASAPQWRARDSPSPWRMSPPLTPQRHPHLFSFTLTHSFLLFFPVLQTDRYMKTASERKSWKQRKKEGHRSQRAACLLWVGNDIMRGLQCLVGGSFYSNCQDKCAIIHFDWVSVCARLCACMYVCTTARRTCVTGSWLGDCEVGQRETRRVRQSQERGKGKWKERTWLEEKEKGKQRGVTDNNKRKSLALALSGGSARGDGRVELRSNKVQIQ